MIIPTPKGLQVYSHDGKRHLGGPHKTRREANERLRQVEAAKAAKASGKPAPGSMLERIDKGLDTASDKLERLQGAVLRIPTVSRLIDSTGVTAIAKAAVGSLDTAIGKAVTLAREEGVPEKHIRAALRAQQKAEQLQSMIALLLPIVPSPKLMRLLARK